MRCARLMILLGATVGGFLPQREPLVLKSPRLLSVRRVLARDDPASAALIEKTPIQTMKDPHLEHPTVASDHSQEEEEAKKKPQTLRGFMLEYTRRHPEMQDLESLMASVEMACKTISALVQRAGLDDSIIGAAGATNVQGEDQKKLDVVSNDVLKDALRYTGRLGVVASEEETHPVLVEEAYDSKYVAVFDPLDGSSNVDAAIATGTIFGIFRQTEECVLGHTDAENNLDPVGEKCLLNALQPGDSLVAAGYCMYSSSCVLVLTLGDGVFGFTLDPTLNEFFLSHDRMRVPKRGTIYSVNEANAFKWDEHVQNYINTIKRGDGVSKEMYSSRYVGSMVADVHRTLLYGGIYAYPADTSHPNGKIRLLYEAAPMSFVMSQAGGRASTGTEDIMNICPKFVHQRVPCFLGSPLDVDELESYFSSSSSSEEEKDISSDDTEDKTM